jgi:hypothetical protein
VSFFIAKIPTSTTLHSIFSISKPYSVLFSGIIFFIKRAKLFMKGETRIAPKILNHTANTESPQTKSDFNQNILSNK